MRSILNVPSWANEGPEDFEYRTYRMLSHANSLRELLKSGKLWDALIETDEVLDFLYHYDAEKMIERDVFSSTQLTNVDWDNIELVYETGTELADENLLDELVDQAIDVYEVLHSEIREQWRILDSAMTISYAGNRPYFVNDGFVIVTTPDNMVHLYSFNNPSVNYQADWKKFKLVHISTEKYNPNDILLQISEIKEKDENKIVYRVNLKNTIKLEGGPINVISSNVFMRLRKDYGF